MNNLILKRTGDAQETRDIVTSIYKSFEENRDIPANNADQPNCLARLRNFYTTIAGAFPDYKLNIDYMLVSGDRVMVRYMITGTHEGSYMGMSPTRKRMVITGIDIFEVEDGTVVEHRDTAHQIAAER